MKKTSEGWWGAWDPGRGDGDLPVNEEASAPCVYCTHGLTREINHAIRPAVTERLQALDEVGDGWWPRFAQGRRTIDGARGVDEITSGGGR